MAMVTRLPAVVASNLVAGGALSGGGKALAPRRVIERSGGVLVDVSPSGRRRYWPPSRRAG
ncbi:hypothetical protein FB474_0359 [Oryzihumus leptocrescens]|uniref:Uncharacterized protein n=1 Tax=Oryzihumus leptocrescens TaxID=297536 RepID=A0A542ZF96_9MICO|nr:hypothetical protein FB474_0359 [Oryzihumus leptocrescens]